MRDGNDTVCLLDVEAGNLHIHLGRDHDRLDLRLVDVAHRTLLRGDDGFDTIGVNRGDTALRGLSVKSFEDRDLFVNCFVEEV